MDRYAYLIGNIGTLLTSADKSASACRHRKELVEVFMEARKVPVNVRYHVLDFFKVQWDAMHVRMPSLPRSSLPHRVAPQHACMGCVADSALGDVVTQGADPREAIKDLPVSLQTDVMYELCAKHIRRIRLFATASDDLLRSMVATIVVEMIPAVRAPPPPHTWLPVAWCENRMLTGPRAWLRAAVPNAVSSWGRWPCHVLRESGHAGSPRSQ